MILIGAVGRRCGAVTLMYLSTETEEVPPGVSTWEIFQITMLMCDSQDIETVEHLLVTVRV